MATTAAVPEAPLRILPAPDPQQHPPARSPKLPRKKRGRPKGRKNRPHSPQPRPQQSIVSNPAPSPSADSRSLLPSPSATEERKEEFDRATAAVPAAIAASSPVPGPGLPGETPPLVADLEPAHNFQAIAQEYLPKIFNILGILFDHDHWKLRPTEEKILVPECAGSIEELWPWLSKIFDGVRFPRTAGFGVALAIPVMVRIMEERKVRAEERKQQQPEKPDPLRPPPDLTAHATATPGSGGSSGSSASPDAAKPTAWGSSFTGALGSSS